MKKVSAILTLLVVPFLSFAQIQSGKVRTAGTLTNKGEPISGVSIKMCGNYNLVLSNQQGNFEVQMTGLKNGDPISVERVFKPGYVLLDENYIYSEKSFSTRVPLEIVMKSKALIEKERREIEETAYANINTLYEQRLCQLDSALRESLISAEDKQKELEILQEQYQAYESLITTLSKHYSMMDYDIMSDIDVEINRCIRDGDLLRADSLLNSKGKLDRRINNYLEEVQLVANAEKELEKAKKRLSARKNDLQHIKKSLAVDLFNKYAISLGRFNQDSAEYYILARANLDTTNVDWQLDAGYFLENYSGKYQEAYGIYLKTLRIAEQNDYNPEAVGNIYNSLGVLMNSLGQYSTAMQFLQKAKELYDLNPNLHHPNKAAVRNNIAGVYGSLRQADSMLVYAQEALLINQTNFGEMSKECAVNWNMIANAYDMKGDHQAALEIYKELISIYSINEGKESLYVALTYNNIASSYARIGNLAMAIDALTISWDIILKITDQGNIHRATIASNAAIYLSKAGRSREAVEWIDRAIDVLEAGHSNMSLLQLCYQKKGIFLVDLGLYDAAVECYDKGLACWNSPDVELDIMVNKAYLLERFGYMQEALTGYKELLNKYEFNKPVEVEFTDDMRRNLDGYINQLYIKILQTRSYDSDMLSMIEDEYKSFLRNKIYLFVVASPEGPAGKVGLSGINYLLKMNDWDADCLVDFFYYSPTLSGKEKDVVLFTPDGIKQFTFKDKLGAHIYMDRIPDEWKTMIMNEYQLWQHNNK